MNPGRRLILGFCWLWLAALLVVSRAQNPAGPRFDYRELANVPEKARRRDNPGQGDPKAVLIGKKLYRQHCAECHGRKGDGTKKAPSLQAGEVQQAAPGALFWILTNGVVRRGMPVWSKLPEPQRWDLVSYIQTLKPTTEGAGTGPP